MLGMGLSPIYISAFPVGFLLISSNTKRKRDYRLEEKEGARSFLLLPVCLQVLWASSQWCFFTPREQFLHEAAECSWSFSNPWITSFNAFSCPRDPNGSWPELLSQRSGSHFYRALLFSSETPAKLSRPLSRVPPLSFNNSKFFVPSALGVVAASYSC